MHTIKQLLTACDGQVHCAVPWMPDACLGLAFSMLNLLRHASQAFSQNSKVRLTKNRTGVIGQLVTAQVTPVSHEYASLPNMPSQYYLVSSVHLVCILTSNA